MSAQCKQAHYVCAPFLGETQCDDSISNHLIAEIKQSLLIPNALSSPDVIKAKMRAEKLYEI